MDFDRDFPAALKQEVLSGVFDVEGSGPIAAGRDREGDWAVFYRPSVQGGISWTRKIALGDWMDATTDDERDAAIAQFVRDMGNAADDRGRAWALAILSHRLGDATDAQNLYDAYMAQLRADQREMRS